MDGHPTGLNVQLGHTLVVAPEKSTEVLRQILFVVFSERAHNAKVQGNVATHGFRLNTDLDIARVHVSMEKTIAKYLREKKRHAIFGQLGNVHARSAQGIHLTDGQALHALHDDDFGVTVIPIHLWNQNQIQTLHVSAKLRAVGGLSNQVQLIVQMFVKLSHHLAGFEALAICTDFFKPAGHHAHQVQIFFNRLQHVGAQHFDCHLLDHTVFVLPQSKVNLRNGCAGHRHMVKGLKDFRHWPTKSALDGGHRNV